MKIKISQLVQDPVVHYIVAAGASAIFAIAALFYSNEAMVVFFGMCTLTFMILAIHHLGTSRRKKN